MRDSDRIIEAVSRLAADRDELRAEHEDLKDVVRWLLAADRDSPDFELRLARLRKLMVLRYEVNT